MAQTLLYILPSKNYFQSLLSVLKKEAKKNNKSIIYVTTNKPHGHLVNLFKDEGIDSEKMFFIDCISKQAGSKKGEEASNCLMLESPQDITSLSLAINKAVNIMKGEKMLFLDSLSTLLIYNNEEVVGKFSNFIINKMRNQSVSTLMLTLESDADKKIIKVIQSFVDEVKQV